MRTPPRLDQLNLLAGHRQLHCPHTDHLDLLGAYAHGLAADLGGRGSAVQRRPDPDMTVRIPAAYHSPHPVKTSRRSKRKRRSRKRIKSKSKRMIQDSSWILILIVLLLLLLFLLLILLFLLLFRLFA